MQFDVEEDEGSWTLDDSIPLKVYSNTGNSKVEPEFIFELCCNKTESENLLKAAKKLVELHRKKR